MKTTKTAILLASLLLSACGGGGGGGGGGDSGTSSQSATFTFVPPTEGQTATYVETITDVAGDSATYNYNMTVGQVNSNGSFLLSWTPSVSGYTLSGDAFSLQPEEDTYDSVGEITEYTSYDPAATNIGGDTYSCNYSYTAGGQPATLTQGQSFDDSISYKCQGSSTSSSQTVNGTFLGIESVTVPAGTFNAYKLQYVETTPAPSPSSGSTTSITTTWLDASPTSSRRIKMTTQYTFTGYTPAADATQTSDMELSSYQ